jgi:hypothetical protein
MSEASAGSASSGTRRRRNDDENGDLRVATYAATPSRRGAHTSFRVTKLADARAVRVRCDGVDDPQWHAVGDDTIEIECDIGEHCFEIATHGRARDDASERRRRGIAEAGRVSRAYVPAPPPTCAAPCCGPSQKST